MQSLGSNLFLRVVPWMRKIIQNGCSSLYSLLFDASLLECVFRKWNCKYFSSYTVHSSTNTCSILWLLDWFALVISVWFSYVSLEPNTFSCKPSFKIYTIESSYRGRLTRGYHDKTMSDLFTDNFNWNTN